MDFNLPSSWSSFDSEHVAVTCNLIFFGHSATRIHRFVCFKCRLFLLCFIVVLYAPDEKDRKHVPLVLTATTISFSESYCFNFNYFSIQLHPVISFYFSFRCVFFFYSFFNFIYFLSLFLVFFFFFFGFCLVFVLFGLRPPFTGLGHYNG